MCLLKLQFHYFGYSCRILIADSVDFFIDGLPFFFTLGTNKPFLQCIHLFLRYHIRKVASISGIAKGLAENFGFTTRQGYRRARHRCMESV